MQDMLVGIITCVTGLWFIAGAVRDHQFLFDLHRIRWLVKAFGRRGARIALALLGFGLIALGVAICVGWRLQLF